MRRNAEFILSAVVAVGLFWALIVALGILGGG